MDNIESARQAAEALHAASLDFRALPVVDAAEAVRHFTEAHARYTKVYSKGTVVEGKTDMVTYARIWVKSYFGYES